MAEPPPTAPTEAQGYTAPRATRSPWEPTAPMGAHGAETT